jgi:hypothetical protein
MKSYPNLPVRYLLIAGLLIICIIPFAAAAQTVSGPVPGDQTTGPINAEPPVHFTGDSPLYGSPGAAFSVKTIPDLNIQRNILAKGAPLTINVTTSPGNSVGLWITSGFPVNNYSHFEMISADSSGNAGFSLPDTTGMRSGQYFIFIVDGGKKLEVIPDKDPAAFMTAETLEGKLKALEQLNPYRKSMILLEEPAIRMTDLPDAISGTPVEIEGTTNLNTGTVLDIGIFTPDIDRLKQPAFNISGIRVTGGADGTGVWGTVVNTSDLPPGEYIVKVRNGTVEAARTLVLYDSLYDAGIVPGANLTVKTYEVDPMTKTIVNVTPPRKPDIPLDPGIPVIVGFAGVIGLGVIVMTFRKK